MAMYFPAGKATRETVENLNKQLEELTAGLCDPGNEWSGRVLKVRSQFIYLEVSEKTDSLDPDVVSVKLDYHGRKRVVCMIKIPREEKRGDGKRLNQKQINKIVTMIGEEAEYQVENKKRQEEGQERFDKMMEEGREFRELMKGVTLPPFASATVSNLGRASMKLSVTGTVEERAEKIKKIAAFIDELEGN